MPISTLTGTWTRLISEERLRRSSQVLSVVGQTVAIFGGEVKPREPVDNQVDILSLQANAPPRLSIASSSSAPQPRVGSASAVINGKLYLFSGRGGTDMAPLEEHGVVWSFDPSSASWSRIEPKDASGPFPQARSYHCAASDGDMNFFVHAGCPAKGRLSDLWAFNVLSRTWSQLPDAPAPHRGGTSLAYSSGRLYRMNGFDGTKEQGGSIDTFDISKQMWSTKTFSADGNAGPEPRSVCALVPIKVQGKNRLVTLFGEHDPSSLGHAGAGKMLSDVWVYDIAEEWWTKLPTTGSDGLPDARGWFDGDVVTDSNEKESILIHGGLGENNERLSDVWLLSF